MTYRGRLKDKAWTWLLRQLVTRELSKLQLTRLSRGTGGSDRNSDLNIPSAQYPCVYPDHRATFRVVAPDAQKVQVRVGQTFDMVKGSDEAWTVTSTPLVVGFHYDSVVIDGATVADPATRTFFGSGWENSGIEIPEAADVAFFYLNYLALHSKLAASSVLPEPLYFATCGYGQIGRDIGF